MQTITLADGYYDDPYDDDEERGPALEVYGTDLTVLAQDGLLDECFGRDTELLELMEILVRRQKNNPVLVGDAGVGKTAIVELFATKLVNNLVPFVLEGRSIVSLDLARIVAGSRYRGEFELRFQRILDEVLAQPHIIVFIDEIHNLGGTGSAEGSLDAANILKPVLSRSGFQCIGATTTKEYQKIEKDPALNRRFQPIQVKEPSIEDTVKILYGLRPALESFHNVEILPGTLRLSAELAARYIHERFLPDKAIDLIDRASAKAVIELTNVTEGSVVSGIVNASINHLGSLRLEAFRRGDVPSEYILQELENAYRNFLLQWIEDPTSIPEAEEFKPGIETTLGEENQFSESEFDDEQKAENTEVEEPEIMIVSPLSQDLFDTMRLSILKRVDELFFASNNPRYVSRRIRRVCELSVEKNQQVFVDLVHNMNDAFNKKEPTPLSLYRIGLFYFGEWLEADRFKFLTEDFKPVYFSDLVKVGRTVGVHSYIWNVRSQLNEDQFSFSRDQDFCTEDVESYEETFELLSELEEKRILLFEEFLLTLKPVLRKGIIESLKHSSKIPMNDDELRLVYDLIGYFSTDTGRDYLVNLEDPELIRMARKTGDFSGLKKRISQREIRELLANMTGIPIQTISSVESQKLLNLEATLHKRVIGQEEAISAIAKAIRRSRLGIQNPNRPLASFLFCGPTGVGKTEVTKALAVSMFGSESDMIRFDMSEFMEKFTVSRLIGSPPGYVGYDEGGQLTDAVRRKPYSVVLFDEVEKAHPDILNILLQILEDGRLTDSQKRLVPFDNTVIIMTSNAAAEEIQQIIKTERSEKKLDEDLEQEKERIKREEDERTYYDSYAGAIQFLNSPINENFFKDLKTEIGFEFEKSFLRIREIQKAERPNINGKVDEVINPVASSNLKSAVLERLSTMFLPEFLNRLDDIIIFQPLKPEELRKICDIMVQEVTERIKPKKVLLTVDERVRLKLTRQGYNPLFGARPLRRLITKYIEDLVSESLLKSPLLKKPKNVKILLDENDDIILKE